MLFPKSRISFTRQYQGKTVDSGYYVLDLTGVDLDGANKLYLSIEDLEKLKAAGEVAVDRLKRARMLLGGEEE